MTTRSTISAFPVPLLAEHFPTSTAVRGDVLRFPGVSDESTQTVRRLLEDSDRRFHIYQKISYQHNHLPHHLLAAYSLGASASHLRAIFDADVPGMAPLERSLAEGGEEVLKSPPLLDEGNWWDARFLGNTKYYAAYLAFFHREVETLGPQKTFVKYIMSDEANAGPPTATKPPKMFIRFLAGAFHPFIHTGYGIEFHDRVVFAEGLAQVAVHSPDILAKLFEPGWPTAPAAALPYDPSQGGPSPLELYSELCSSPSSDPGPFDPDALITARMRTALQDGRGEEMRRIASQWVLSPEFTPLQWEERYEEIAVFVTLLACSTSRPGRDVRVDFFLMHCLTSSIFLPSLANLLSPAERVTLLRSYLLTIFHIALCRGRPRIQPATILENTPFPAPPVAEVSNGTELSLQIVGRPSVPANCNPWLPIVTSAMYARDSHVLKSIRALLHYSTLYGQRPPGWLLGAYKHDEAIPGVGELGGDVFQRAAGMIMRQTGWVREGEKANSFDLSALGWDGAWA